MTKVILIITSALALSACVALPPERLPITTEKREFLYDYSIPGATKDDLYTRANDYLAISYKNSKVISRIEDKERGTIISKAVSNWQLSTGDFLIKSVPCYSNYDIYFIAKDGRARLQLELVEGAPNPSVCGWKLPPKQDYPQLVNQFESIAMEMEEALSGNSKINQLNDF